MRLINYTYPAVRSPYSGLETEFGRLFNSVFTDFSGSSRNRLVPVELTEDKDNAYVRAELPGVGREDIGVEILEGTLTIQASRKSSSGEGEPVSLTRSVALPEDIQTDKVAGVYENGVLTVTLPKKEQAKPQKIQVSVK